MRLQQDNSDLQEGEGDKTGESGVVKSEELSDLQSDTESGTSSDSDNTVIIEDTGSDFESTIMAQSERVHMPLLHKCTNYSSYKTRLDGWNLLTKVDKKDRAMVVAMSLPYKDDDKENRFNGIRDKVFENLKGEDLMKADGSGYALLTKYLDDELGKDEVEKELERYMKNLTVS